MHLVALIEFIELLVALFIGFCLILSLLLGLGIKISLAKLQYCAYLAGRQGGGTG